MMKKSLVVGVALLSIFIYFPIFCFVKEIEVEGNILVPTDEIKKISELDSKLLTLINRNATTKKIKKIKLIHKVRYEQVSLRKIKIIVKERKILMSVNINNTKGHIDEDLIFIRNISEYLTKTYPILTVQNKSQINEGMLIINLLKKEEIYIDNNISEILIDSLMGATIFTNDGVEIYLGKKEYGKKIKNLSVIVEDGRNKGMKENYIDLSNINKGVVNYNL